MTVVHQSMKVLNSVKQMNLQMNLDYMLNCSEIIIFFETR